MVPPSRRCGMSSGVGRTVIAIAPPDSERTCFAWVYGESTPASSLPPGSDSAACYTRPRSDHLLGGTVGRPNRLGLQRVPALVTGEAPAGRGGGRGLGIPARVPDRFHRIIRADSRKSARTPDRENDLVCAGGVVLHFIPLTETMRRAPP